MSTTIDKVIVITGASAGIGAAAARALGARGASVVLVARREAVLGEVAAASGPRALPVVADVTRREDVAHVVEAALGRFGHVDVWVNNAGRGITRAVADLTDDDVDEMMLVNVKSALYGVQAILPHMKARGRGQIINVASLLGRISYVSGRAAYSAAKHALLALTTNLRVDLRAEFPGIHVSAFLPGVVATEFGINALHGGVDSRVLPMAQPVQEVADVLVDLIEHPRAEAFTRSIYKEQVSAYYSAVDLAEIEAKPPFTR